MAAAAAERVQRWSPNDDGEDQANRRATGRLLALLCKHHPNGDVHAR
jgi:hypothetical protein